MFVPFRLRAREGRVPAFPAIAVALAALTAGVVLAWRSQRDEAAPVPAEILRGKPLRAAPDKAPNHPAQAAPPPPLALPSPAPSSSEEYLELEVGDLANFDYEEAAASGTIPAPIQAWNGRRVELHGYMNPVRFDEDGVAEFTVTAYPGACCFGMVPRLNEWVKVDLPEGESAEYAFHAPIVVLGTLEVGEEIQDGVVQSLFRMTAEQVAVED